MYRPACLWQTSCMPIAASQSAVIIKRIAEQYGLSAVGVSDSEKGYRSHMYKFRAEGLPLCIVIYKNEPGILLKIKAANSVSDFLAAKGFACRRTRDPRIIVIATGKNRRYAAIYHYLPGKVIPWEGYTKKHLKAAGSALAQMHRLLMDYDQLPLPAVEDESLKLVDDMDAYFSRRPVTQAMQAKLQISIDLERLVLYRLLLLSTKRLPARQALHMDFVRGNILFDNNDTPKISGVLDFEKVATGHRTFDIARALAFLTVDSKYKQPGEVYDAFFTSGYIRRGRMGLPKVRYSYKGAKFELLPLLMEFFWLHDFFKFLKHNPYESLNQNQHYLRTRNLMLELGLAKRAG